MRPGSSRWRRMPRTRPCSGSSRASAASSRSKASTFPAGLARTVRSDAFEVRIDEDFDGVIAGCAAPGFDRQKTWISDRIRQLYGDLFDLGHCHTVEVYRDGRLVGGLYGVRLGAAFFGESMFHTRAGCLEGRPRPPRRPAAGGRVPPPRHPVRHRASRPVRRPRGAAAGLQDDAPGADRPAADWYVWPRLAPGLGRRGPGRPGRPTPRSAGRC